MFTMIVNESLSTSGSDRANDFFCDRCGDLTLDGVACRCSTPSDPVIAAQRYRAAVALARASIRSEKTNGARFAARAA
jgi:hypothetical protein